MFALVDCDQFYVSCERIFRPDLRYKPVAVLSNNDGCVIARSPELKALGIKMGAPYYQVKDTIQRSGGTVFSSNYELYGNISERVISILRTFTGDVEIYSIDEAFIKLPYPSEYHRVAADIVKKVKKWIDVPVKVGIAETKTLCKVAAELVKKNQIKEKYLMLTDKSHIESILEVFDVGDIWGIGWKLRDRLYRLGIKTAGQLCRYPEDKIKKKFGVNLVRTVMELKGICCFTVGNMPSSKKSLCYSKSFGRDIIDKMEMHESIVDYVEAITEKLRRGKQFASAVTVYITTHRFKDKEQRYSNSYTLALGYPSSNTREILDASIKCLDVIFKEGYRYKKSGIILSGLVDEAVFHENLFSLHKDSKNEKIDLVVDRINEKFGKGSIKLAGGGLLKKSNWKMKREHLSKHYTTDWNGLPEIGE